MREITKTYEETIRGTLGELAERFRREQALGEIVDRRRRRAGERRRDVVRSAGALTVEDLIEAGLSLKQASALIAKLTGASRREVYQEALKHRAKPTIIDALADGSAVGGKLVRARLKSSRRND